MMWNFLAVALGGAVGACSRHGITELLKNEENPSLWPASTFLANVIGCLVIGLLIALVEQERITSEFWRKLLLTGFVGSLTTFSTFSAETLGLIKKHEYGLAGLYLFSSLLCGFMALICARWFVERFVN